MYSLKSKEVSELKRFMLLLVCMIIVAAASLMIYISDRGEAVPTGAPAHGSSHTVTDPASGKSEYVQSAGMPQNYIPAEELTAPSVAEEKIIEYCQYPDYPTGCESASLYILLQYYDIEVTMEEIVEALPKGPRPYEGANGVIYGADPEKEFVGDPTLSNSYGVFNQPIAETANGFKDGAVAVNGISTFEIEKIVSNGVPLIAWVSMYPEKEPTVSRWYDYVTSEQITWVGGEHAVVVYGEADGEYLISDPITGEKGVLTEKELNTGLERYGGKIVYYPEE